MKNIPQRNVWKKEESKVAVSVVNTNCMDEMQKNGRETNNIARTKKVTATQPHSLLPSSVGSDASMSNSGVSSSSSVEILMAKRNKEVARLHSYDDLDKPSSGKASRAVENKGSKFSLKGMMSNMPVFVARGAPPEFPLEYFHIEALSKDMNVVKILVSELQLNEKWELTCRREKSDFFRVDLFFKWWWSSHIREGYKAKLRQLTDILAKHGREDLRDHINKVPDFGTFHETVVVVLASSVGNKWRILMKELGLKEQDVSDRMTEHMSSHECTQCVLEMWQEKELGCTKLHQLVDACRAMKLITLADDIEQGLTKDVLQRIARRIQREYIEKLGDCLEVSWIRRDAFQKKFPFLWNRIFHILCWWSMRQPLHVDKAEKLYGYLEEIKLEKIAAAELSRVPGPRVSILTSEEKIRREREAWKVEKQQMDTKVMELKGQVENLLGQLEQMKRQSPEETKRLEESQKKQLSLSQYAVKLETELRQTRDNLTLSQTEVERLKKELEETRKQLQTENESDETSTKGDSDDSPSPVELCKTRNSSIEEFGKFQFHLSSHLTRDIIRDLCLVLDFFPSESEQAEDKYKFIRFLKEKGHISPADITPLANALFEIGRHGVLDAVKNSFQSNQSEALR